jgi:hypothetical protein
MSKLMPPANTLEDELWRRAETRREATLYPDASAEDRLLLPLILSLARLAAQQDCKARPRT